MIRAFELHLFTGELDEYEWTAVHIVTYTQFPLITINMQISSTIKRNNISVQENLVQVYGMALHETFMFHYIWWSVCNRWSMTLRLFGFSAVVAIHAAFSLQLAVGRYVSDYSIELWGWALKVSVSIATVSIASCSVIILLIVWYWETLQLGIGNRPFEEHLHSENTLRL